MKAPQPKKEAPTTIKQPFQSLPPIKKKSDNIQKIWKVHPYPIDYTVMVYELVVWENLKQVQVIEGELTSRREEVAELLTQAAKAKNKTLTKTIKKLSSEESAIQEDMYSSQRASQHALRAWRKGLAEKCVMKDWRDNALSKLSEFTKLLSMDSTEAKITNTGWRNVIVPKTAVRYDASLLLGEGAFGKVYKGIVYGSRVAIKELKTTSFSPEQARQAGTMSAASARHSFENEVWLLSEIKHERVLKFMGACLHEGNGTEDPPYIALFTEIADNGSLSDVLYKQGSSVKLSIQRKFKIIGEIAQGMFHLHSLKPCVIHLDLKPANILLDIDYHVLIADFGMSRVRSAESVVSEFGNVVGGTPFYMAPEVLDANFGSVGATEKADVYSFAVLVNELLTEEIPYTKSGKPPKTKMTFDDLKKKVLSDEEKPGTNRPALATDNSYDHINDLIIRGWKKKPEERFSFIELMNYAEEERPWVKALLLMTASVDKKINKAWDKVRDQAKHTESLPFLEFLRILSEKYISLDDICKKHDSSNVYYRLLLYFMEASNGAIDIVNSQKIERFAQMTKNIPINDLLLTLYATATSPWFNGFLKSDQLPSLFKKQSPGSYTVVWSDNGSWNIKYILPASKKDKTKAPAIIETKQLSEVSLLLMRGQVENFVALNKLKTPVEQDYLLKAMQMKKEYLAGAATGVYGTSSKDKKSTDFTSSGTVSHYTFVL